MYVCEYLPRLNCVSTVLDFDEDVKSITRIAINNNNLQVESLLVKSSLKLPVESDELTLTSCKKSGHSLVLSFKLKSYHSHNNFMSLLEVQPWSCKDLLRTPKNNLNQNMFRFRCAHCARDVINSHQFNKFSDMPSDLWAEMMDFWHCHKPVSGKDFTTTKNYNGNLKPSPTSILIGNNYILVNNEIEVVVHQNTVRCVCGGRLGEVDENKSLKLFKWNLQLAFADTVETYSPYLCIYNLLLDKINSQAVRKVLVHDYIVWIFNIGIDVALEGIHLVNASKILYCKKAEQDHRIFDDEIVVTETGVFEDFIRELDTINQLVPQDSRTLAVKEDSSVMNYKISYLGLYK
ncbi:HECT-type E3 ubiquitin transferase [Yamadazyma tenuis]|uniref:Ubiquitin-conjugating enzyme E2C-binding protein n=1 Tax=Candida tenuis (strain ATCC 10573 / BCRC 21748 / CBS 615 / JCM 9827 / NBRC 10315 / NRRL Y-1498 / VKM Y-70) TaxID=590646 RepID=G3BFL5_CANTC|nr:uncharacterized protein CANTEDRAFT_126860 [Yamadazyma tenuis ATCC 10573]EGV60046.1 hypothetical protein CANTEDRAFT_126860 [Yamadazyma tenuis ATCC 10573]WEJ94726.1 HECT-type E3 ubiquitin transferase [Yamadazyma tenuis]